MTFLFFDLIKGTLEGEVFGSAALLILFVILMAMILIWRADVPPYFFFLLIAPLIIGVAQIGGVAPTYLWSGTIIILGVILAVGFLKLFR